jgi:hypothetical protein
MNAGVPQPEPLVEMTEAFNTVLSLNATLVRGLPLGNG